MFLYFFFMLKNIPKSIIQGDRITWKQDKLGYDPNIDTMACFIRGQSNPIDLTGTPVADGWIFTLESAESSNFVPGKYKIQVVAFLPSGKETVGIYNFSVHPSFENITQLETRTPDEIELEDLNKAISKLASGAVAEYEIGDRKMRYQDLDKLTRRQEYLRRRIAIAQGRVKPGGRNIGVRYSNW